MKYPLPDQELLFSDGTQHLRWFLLPSEAQNCIDGNPPPHLLPESLPFVPKSFMNKESLILQNPSLELYSHEISHTNHNNSAINNDKNNDYGNSLQDFDSAEKAKEFSESIKNFLEKGFQNSLSDKPVEKVLTYSSNTNITEEYSNTENITPKSYNCEFDNYLLRSNSQARRNKIVWDQRLLPGHKEKVNSISSAQSQYSHLQQDTMNNASQPSINTSSVPKSNPLDVISSKSQSNILVNLSTNDTKSGNKEVGMVKADLMPTVCHYKPKSKKSDLKKTKKGSFWFSPPKEIFTPAVKVSDVKLVKLFMKFKNLQFGTFFKEEGQISI